MTVADIARIAARRWRVVLVAIAMLLGLGIGAWVALPKSYTASATLVVSPINNDLLSGTGSNDEVNIHTEQEILGSPEVARQAAKALGMKLSADSFLLSRTDVAAPSGSQVLRVSVTVDDPQQAAAAANAIADAYLSFRSEGAKAVAKRYMDAIDERMKSLDPNDDKALIASLEEQRQSLEMVGSDPGRIIGRAQIPGHPSTPSAVVFAAGGASAGLLAGIFAGLVRERLDRRVRSRDRLRFDAVVAAEVADSEAWRWVMLDLEPILAGKSASRVAIYAAKPLDAAAVIEAALQAIRTRGTKASLLEPDELLTVAIDHGWPGTARAVDSGIAVVDLSSISSLAQVSAAASDTDAAVVLVSRKSLQSVTEVVDVIADRSGHDPQVVFVGGRRSSMAVRRKMIAAHRGDTIGRQQLVPYPEHPPTELNLKPLHRAEPPRAHARATR